MSNADMPAMPVNEIHQAGTELGGLTKREYIAAMAMQGLLSGGKLDDFEIDAIAEYTALDAVIIADALLAELGKTS